MIRPFQHYLFVGTWFSCTDYFNVPHVTPTNEELEGSDSIFNGSGVGNSDESMYVLLSDLLEANFQSVVLSSALTKTYINSPGATQWLLLRTGRVKCICDHLRGHRYIGLHRAAIFWEFRKHLAAAGS